jgi:DNA polymerase
VSNCNFQNLTGDLAEAVQAPPGHVVVCADASQIELRLLSMIAGQWDIIDTLRAGGDPYASTASAFYGFEVNKKGHPNERQHGKTVKLASGFGAGGPRIAAALRKEGVPCDDAGGERWKNAYRSTHWPTVNLWHEADGVLAKLAAGMTFTWRDVVEVRNKRIYLPNGLPLIYDTLEKVEGEWQLKTRRGSVKMYGAKLVENLVQALSATHTRGAWLACIQVGMKMVSMMHDSLVAVVPEKDGESALQYMQNALSTEPPWLPGIPLGAEGYISTRLSRER